MVLCHGNVLGLNVAPEAPQSALTDEVNAE